MNAAQAMQGGGRLTIECSGVKEHDKHTIRLSVSDTGTGVSKKIRHRIFEPGFSTKKDGNGIGLSTVKEIVEEHRGTIKVDSTAGKGTTFSIDIPDRTVEEGV